METYNQLQTGMARPDVERILGGKGQMLTPPSNSNGTTFAAVKWQGEQGRQIVVTFENDKIMTKSQVGLK